MKEYKILVVEEDEIRDGHLIGSDRPLWTANHVIIRKNNGTCETLKDRYKYSSNNRKAEIYLPPN